MWNEDEKDLFFSYTEGQKIVAKILAFGEELEYKKFANVHILVFIKSDAFTRNISRSYI